MRLAEKCWRALEAGWAALRQQVQRAKQVAAAAAGRLAGRVRTGLSAWLNRPTAGAVMLRLGERAVNLGAAALAGALVLAVLGQCLGPSFHSVNVLLNLPTGAAAGCVIQVVLAAGLVMNPRWRVAWPGRVLLANGLLACAAVAMWDTAGYYAAWLDGRIVPGRALPLSFYVGALLAVRAVQWARPGVARRRAARPGQLAVAALAGAFLLPLAEQFFFGSTEYCQGADVAVVFGAGVYADGRPSDALRDRVMTAVELYRSGRAGRLLMSGGIDPGHGRSEPEAMRCLAVQAGVPPEAILVDEAGNNTQASVRNTVVLMRVHGWDSCLAVSHDFHLPRIKRLLERAGAQSYTVPAHERWPLTAKPYFRLREVAAWHYYLLGLQQNRADASGVRPAAQDGA